MTTTEIKSLEGAGVRFTFYGEEISNVKLPFSPELWCQIGQQEGAYYVGGCCGLTSAMQDIINQTFRNGGWMYKTDLINLADLAQNHPDGFELWGETMTDERLAEVVSGFAESDPWDQLAIIWHAASPFLRDSNIGGIAPSTQRPDNFVSALWRGARYLTLKNICNDADENEHATTVMLAARCLPAAHEFIRTYSRLKPFQGFAIVHADSRDKAIDNGYGYCFYATRSLARKVINRWEKTASARSGKFEIRPIKITAEEGLVFLDTEKS